MENLDGVGDLIGNGVSGNDNDDNNKNNNDNYLPSLANFLLIDGVGFVVNQSDARNILEDNNMRNQIASDLTSLFCRQYQKLFAAAGGNNDEQETILTNLSTTAYHIIFRCLDSYCEKLFYSALELSHRITEDEEEGEAGNKVNIAKYLRNMDKIFNYRLEKYVTTLADNANNNNNSNNDNNDNDNHTQSPHASASPSNVSPTQLTLSSPQLSSSSPTDNNNSSEGTISKVATTWKSLKARNKFKSVVDLVRLSPVKQNKGWQSPHSLNLTHLNSNASVNEGTQTADFNEEENNEANKEAKLINMIPNQKRCLIYTADEDDDEEEGSDDEEETVDLTGFAWEST